ncbi:hypothetical protein P9302_25100 [Brevibacillus agri]|uniref:hypothetical protein n=1 Tax=Brevibacillus agri TaxID=51101 RepID=UPI002E22B5AE|nr:hypothetical protein [Brevibacillus agri]
MGSQQTSASQNANKQKPSKQSEPKDRLGQAVVAMIFGIFGLILFIVTWLKMDYDSTHSYTISAGTAITAFFAFIFNVAGFILGIRARRSSKGRGMAIAGITLTAIPFVLITLFLVISVVGYFVMWH